MRVLLIHNEYRQPGGEDVVVAREGGLLRAHGHEVIEYHRSNRETEAMGFAGKLLLPARMAWSRDSYRDLRRLIRRERPDLAHVHNTFFMISPAAHAACRAEGVPVVQSLHNPRLMCPAASFYRGGRACQDCLGRTFPWPGIVHGCWRGSRGATAIVAATGALHRALGTWRDRVDAYVVFTEYYRRLFVVAGLPAERIFVKPHFVDPDPGPDRATPGNFALFAGRLDASKGVETLLEAWRGEPAIRLEICGDGDLAPLVARESASAMVTFSGRLDRAALTERMKSARFLVWPSEGLFETFGLVAAEAFACGLPVIASRLGVMAEIVVDQRTGLHFEAGNARDLHAKVDWAVRHPDAMAEMGRNARAEYEARFTAARNYARMMEIYAAAGARPSATASRTRRPADVGA